MKRNLLLASLAAVAHAQRPQPQPQTPPLPIEPGHVMSQATYERLVREASVTTKGRT